jgi:phage baseplate assembly protein V
MIEQLKGRVTNMIGRCILSAIDDGRKIQSVQIEALEGEAHDNVERFQNYGITSVPYADAEAVTLFVGGLRSHAIVIAVDDRRYRLTGLAQGEVALYDDLGQVVHLKRDGILIRSDNDIDVQGGIVNLTADTVNVIADAVNLGGAGGLGVARIGDTVSGGVITKGSSKVKSL